jgi:hypothetical protein
MLWLLAGRIHHSTCESTRKLQVHELQLQLARCHDACSDLAAMGGLLDRERIERARLATALSTAKLERCAHSDTCCCNRKNHLRILKSNYVFSLFHCRDSALTDLANAYSDMQAMQAALLDSALYVRFLRAKLLEVQLSDSNRPHSPGMISGVLLDASSMLACENPQTA